jgi:predicted nucleic acid-binding protein
MIKKIIYWDSNCFLALLNNEADKIKLCRGTMQEAEAGKLVIVTSAITFIEVIKMKGKPALGKTAEKTIQEFFDNSFIKIHDVDREVGIRARELMWKYVALQPKDAIHLATAVLRKVHTLHTFDDDLLKLNKKRGKSLVCICKPDIKYQPEFDFPEEGKK